MFLDYAGEPHGITGVHVTKGGGRREKQGGGSKGGTPRDVTGFEDRVKEGRQPLEAGKAKDWILP